MKYIPILLCLLFIFVFSNGQTQTLEVTKNLTIKQVEQLSKDSNIKKGVKAFSKKKYRKAEKYFLKVTDKNPLGAYYLGDLYDDRKFDGFSEETSIKWFLKASQEGLTFAQYDLGLKYLYSSIRNARQAIYWLEISANNGYTESQSMLGEIYENGKYAKQSYEKAVFWFTKAQNNNNFARVRLKYIYENGLADRPDKKSDSFWGTTAANKKYANHSNQELYELAKQAIKEKDFGKMNFLFHLSASKGNTNAQIYIGYLFETGVNAEISYEKAAQWYLKAAKNGNPIAQDYLGKLYQLGKGVQQSNQQAADWYLKAAKENVMHSMLALADLYETGDGIKKDTCQAISLYKTAAKDGNPHAQYRLGHFYEHGICMGNSPRWLAKSWYLKSSDQGNKNGQTNYQRLYDEEAKIFNQGKLLLSNGNITTAISNITKAADLGHLDAQIYLADIYYKGKIVPQNYYKASVLYDKAAKLGHANSQYMMGYMHQYGQFVTKSKFTANIYYEKAIQQDHQLAVTQYNKLNAVAYKKKSGSWKDAHRQANHARIVSNNCKKYAHFTPSGRYGYNESLGVGSGDFIDCPSN